VIRDRGPISSIGHGLTSRDLPVQEGESQGPSPNSGFVGKALNGHPVMRFFATTAASVVAMTVAGKVLRGQGLKLAKGIQDSAEAGSVFSTRAVETITQLRRGLDELEGLSRYVDDTVDPYSKLVFEKDGKLTTGLTRTIVDGDEILENGTYITGREVQQAGGGITREPASVWSLRDDIQQRLVRQARKLPYELPALYLGQKAVIDPLFGHNQDKRKVNWYNPADVIADFAKQSVMNAAFITGGSAVGGGVLARSKFYMNAPYANNPNLALTAKQMRTADRFADLRTVLKEVGHEAGDLINKGSRLASSASGAFNLGVENAALNQGSPVFAMQQARHGAKAMGEYLETANAGRLKIASQKAKAVFFGSTVGDESYQGLIDTLPSMRGFTHGFRAFGEQFKVMKQGYDVVSGAKSFDEAVNAIKLGPNRSATEALENAINVVQRQHRSKFSAFADSVGGLKGAGGPGSTSIDRSQFGRAVQETIYRRQVENYLRHNGTSAEAAANFARSIKVNQLPSTYKKLEVSNRITLGKKQILASNDDDFYDEMARRFRKQNGLIGAPDSNVIRRSIEEADSFLTRKEFQDSFKTKVQSQWNKFYNEDVVGYGNTILKPQKAVYQDFVGPLTGAKEDFLRRRAAQVLNIPLKDADGRLASGRVINSELSKRGIDSNNFGQLRAFLIRNKQMTSQASSGGANLFGMKQLLVDEAFDKGMFNYMQPEQKDFVRDLAARLKVGDPVSRSIGFSKLDGVYQNRNGEIVDLTRVKSMVGGLANFFGTEFQIPVVKFNPLQMLGIGGPTGISKSAPFQIASGMSSQPFGRLESHAADIFVWTKAKNGIFGPKGTMSYLSTDQAGVVNSTKMQGMYRPITGRESNIFSRAAGYAANRGTLSTAELTAAEANRSLTFLERFKKAFDVDEEQPNSLLRLAGRFRNRKQDINNPNFFARLLQEEEVAIGGKNSGKSMSMVREADGTYKVVDAKNPATEIYNHKQVLEAYESFRRTTMQYGTSKRVMSEVQGKISVPVINGQTFDIAGANAKELDDYARGIVNIHGEQKALIRGQGVDPTGLTRRVGRIAGLIDESNASATSSMAAKSPSIATRQDELRNEIYKYLLERHAYLNSRGDPSAVLRLVDEAVLDLKRRGLISAGQAAEARAAGLSTVLETGGYKTFNPQAHTGINKASALSEAMNMARGANKASFQNLASPFTEGTTSIIDTSGLKKTTSLIKPMLTKKFGTAPYKMDEMAGDPFGGSNVTFVPTAGTVIKNVGAKRFLKSASGLSTYSDPEAFSFSSIPISHGFERLNRYFGTLGMGLDANKYRGPLDLYGRGMVGKRVLPIVAGGTGLLAADRTIGGFVNEKDQNNQRVYSPYFTTKAARGVVEAQAVISAAIPGGPGYQEKRDQLLKGNVPIRQGRFWPLGTTPFEGGKIMYYRPSWYRKLQGGAMFTSDTYGSPVEKFMYGNDFSPLRPLDPYRFEKQHYNERPYPVTGEYFSGPWGPLTPLLNATAGKILKPQLKMHEEEVNQALSQYAPAGQSGAYNTAGIAMMSGGGQAIQGGGGFSYGPGGVGAGSYSGQGGGAGIGGYNAAMASRAGSLGTARNMTRSSISDQNAALAGGIPYGPPPTPGMVAPQLIAAGTPISHGNISLQAGELGYKFQETMGIYGFGFGAVRKSFGFGQQDFSPQRSTLQSSAKAYGTTRAFWDLNLGGLGDIPLAAEGALGNIEASEIVRRFIPKERTDINYLNPIRNKMADQYPFLPGADYFTNFQQGDPFTKVQEGELRLPGIGYERLNPYAKGYDELTQLSILGDVAPYSKEFRQLNRKIDMTGLDGSERVRLEEIRSQVENTTKKYDFSEYKFKYSTPEEMQIKRRDHTLGKVGEYIAHRDTFFNTKFLQKRTAQEDWERRNVYGSTFPEWQNPVESFIKPMYYKATQRSPLTAGIGMSVIGTMFARTGRAKAFASIFGMTTGAGFSAYGNAKEAITGERFIPEERKKQMALEEYTDILSYVKNTSLASQAKESGDMASAAQFSQAAKRTMYGADIYGASVDTLSLAIPKRKREHFKAMINAPEEERDRILSTSGRLERRIYQAAWGREVEARPELEDYFSRHELPSANWEGWHPNTNMEHVKIKMGQSMGIEMSQMGYYPQQVKEANLSNPSYPVFNQGQDDRNTAAQLRQLMSQNGINGSVMPVMNQFGSNSASISGGLMKSLVF
jgi:hypothetical protein